MGKKPKYSPKCILLNDEQCSLTHIIVILYAIPQSTVVMYQRVRRINTGRVSRLSRDESIYASLAGESGCNTETQR